MEQITLTVTLTYSRMEVPSKIDKLLIGQEEIPLEGRSIAQCLEEMQQLGWQLTTSRATANLHGIVCAYDFQRPIAMPQAKASTPVDLANPL